MEYYVALSGEKVGPLTQYQLVGMLRDGEVTAEDKVWHAAAADGWQQISEEPSLASALAGLERERERREGLPDEDGAAPDSAERSDAPRDPYAPPRSDSAAHTDSVRARPFSRFLARWYDYMLVMTAVVFFSGVEIPEPEQGMTTAQMREMYIEMAEDPSYQKFAITLYICLFAWHALEGALIALGIPTPGKALMGIRVASRDGSVIPMFKSIYRSFLVYILGVGLFYPLIAVATMILAFFILMSKGSTQWDKWLGMEVRHSPMTFGRILLVVGAFLALMTLQSLI